MVLFVLSDPSLPFGQLRMSGKPREWVNTKELCGGQSKGMVCTESLRKCLQQLQSMAALRILGFGPLT